MKNIANFIPDPFRARSGIGSILLTLCLIGMATLMNSCDLGTIERARPEDGPAFAPIGPGRYVVYDVASVEHFELAEDIYRFYQLKEVFVAPFTDPEGRESWRIERYIRPIGSQRWEIDSVWQARLDNGRYIRTENNTPFIRLAFPERAGLSWNGNAFNALGAETYRIEQFNQPFRVRNRSFNPTLTVLQQRDSSLIHRDFRYEVYAQEIGMVYKRVERFRYIDRADNPFFGKDSIIAGLFLEQVAVEHGVEE